MTFGNKNLVTAAYVRVGEIKKTVRELGWQRWRLERLDGEMADYVLVVKAETK